MHREEHIVTHVLTPEHAPLLTVAIGNWAFQTQDFVVAMEMGSVVSHSSNCDVTMTCVDSNKFLTSHSRSFVTMVTVLLVVSVAMFQILNWIK